MINSCLEHVVQYQVPDMFPKLKPHCLSVTLSLLSLFSDVLALYLYTSRHHDKNVELTLSITLPLLTGLAAYINHLEQLQRLTTRQDPSSGDKCGLTW